MTDKDKAEIYRQALNAVCEKDGWGADGSPPGPCYDIAMRALTVAGESSLPLENGHMYVTDAPAVRAGGAVEDTPQ